MDEGEQCFSKTPSNNPYDAFFKAAFSDPQVAGDLIHNFLPTSYSRSIEKAKLSVDIKDYINRNLTEHQSDLLVACSTAQKELHFYFLYEHKSSPERDTLLKLGRVLFEVLFDLLEKRTEDEDHETDKNAQHAGGTTRSSSQSISTALTIGPTTYSASNPFLSVCNPIETSSLSDHFRLSSPLWCSKTSAEG